MISRSRVYKYDLPMPTGSSDALVSVTTHRGARVVYVGVQHGQPRVWAVVNSEAPPAELRLLVLGTGCDIPGLDLSKWEHLGTLMLASGRLVYHVFQEIAHC